MTATPASASRSATFLLRQPRQVQGFREELAEGVALTMLWIPPGRFWMGSPDTEPERMEREGPQHLVQLQGLFMGQTPITQAQWQAVMGSNPSRFRDQADGNSRPVEQVSWEAAMKFCGRLSQRTGRHYTLPSEAQWEYACRAGTTMPFHFGSTITPALANYNGDHTYANGPKGEKRKQTTPVGMFPANAWGLHDMHGNVWEWCLDHWHANYQQAPADGSAWLDVTEAESNEKDERRRLLRGGSWDTFPRSCRSGYRSRLQPVDASLYVGFRVVCLPQGPSLNP